MSGGQMITLPGDASGPRRARCSRRARLRSGVARRADAAYRLSAATVNRTVAALLLAGVLRERPNRVAAGVNGHPGVPVEVDPRRYVTLGFHLGRGVDTVAIGDLRGQVIVEERLPRPVDRPPALGDLAGTAARLLAGQSGRAPLAAGLVAPWLDLGLDRDGARQELQAVVGLDVATADHVAGVAATEFLHRGPAPRGDAVRLRAQHRRLRPRRRQGRPDRGVSRRQPHPLPRGSGARCVCGRTGCLAATYSDHALVARAASRDLIPAGSDVDVLLDVARRARSLRTSCSSTVPRNWAGSRPWSATSPPPTGWCSSGRATRATRGLPVISDAFTAHTALGPTDLSFTRFGAGVQAVTACTVALGPVYDDPLGVVPARREGGRSPLRSNGHIA